ncbi:unnamed protein product [Prorocentrum cordatum]|uniref:Uncharacterized protein n=1 Tax=Prorocentrum cordatum TaxID=2364126 RepID=A0ABN9PLA7_9DINO|nr:unnamed protein product [Polarella glacialis]
MECASCRGLGDAVYHPRRMYIAGIWSFESLAYLRFTWKLYKTPGFRYGVGLMCIGPVLLPLLWMSQILLFGLQSQWSVLGESVPSGFLLLFSLDFLAFPTTPVHEWPRNSEQLASTQFRRSVLHLFLGGNNNFGVKLMDALWTAQHGDLSRLERYLADPGQARAVLELCCLEQQAEAEKKHRLSRRKGAAGTEDGDEPAE